MKADRYVRREQSFDEFLRENEKHFERMAAYILKRWKAPNDVSIADVAQELRIAAWIYARRYQPDRGKTPAQYVSWNAINKAKKYVHRQRHGRDDRGLGRFDLLSSVGDVTTLMVDEGAQPEVEFEIDRRERLRALVDRCASRAEAVCLIVLFEAESTEVAARSIVNSPELRRICQVETEKEAARMVRKTVKEHAWLG